MSRTHRLTVAIVLLSQVGFLAGMIGFHEYRSHNWQKVRLQTEPVDPVSLFRGRYVRLGYAFDTLETRDKAWMSGDEVLIRLVPGKDGIWRMKEFGRHLEALTGSALLRGEVRYISQHNDKRGQPIRRLHIQTPIETYFLSERQAPQVERLQRGRRAQITVDVALSYSGQAQLEQLYVEGIPAQDYRP